MHGTGGYGAPHGTIILRRSLRSRGRSWGVVGEDRRYVQSADCAVGFSVEQKVEQHPVAFLTRVTTLPRRAETRAQTDRPYRYGSTALAGGSAGEGARLFSLLSSAALSVTLSRPVGTFRGAGKVGLSVQPNVSLRTHRTHRTHSMLQHFAIGLWRLHGDGAEPIKPPCTPPSPHHIAPMGGRHPSLSLRTTTHMHTSHTHTGPDGGDTGAPTTASVDDRLVPNAVLNF